MNSLQLEGEMRRLLFLVVWFAVGCAGTDGPSGLTVDGRATEDVTDRSKDAEVICTPDCDGKQCGSDGCGGECGTCLVGLQSCSEDGVCQAFECESTKDCPGSLLCLKETGECVFCLGDEDCVPGETCGSDYLCHEEFTCTSDLDCKELGLLCDKEAGKCVDCFGPEDCPLEEHCLEHYCVADVCSDGESTCVDGKLLQCEADGSGWQEAVACGEDEYCEDGECRDQVCTPGETFCEGDKVMACDALGKGAQTQDDCGGEEEVCVAGSCVPVVCEPDSVSCADDFSLSNCSADGTYAESEACPAEHYCAEGACHEWVCPPGEAFCDEQTAKECDGVGSALIVEENCAAIERYCIEGECVETVCVPGEPFCSDDLTTAQCAADGSEFSTIPCNEYQYCDGGDCFAMVCVPGASFCDDNVAKVCNGKGSSTLSETECGWEALCVDGACADIICTPGTSSCLTAFTYHSCNGLGAAWSATLACSEGKYCLNGTCLAQSCTPYEAYCKDEKTLEVCDKKGAGPATSGTCAAGTICVVDDCVEQVCVPGAKWCEGVQVATCSGTGLEVTLTNCGVNQYCADGLCYDQVCQPNATLCVGSKVMECDGIGSQLVQSVDCAAQEKACQNGACVAMLCTPNATFCEGNVVKKCSSNGLSISTQQTCANDQYCEESGDLATCQEMICEPNELSCQGTKVMLCNTKGSLLTEVDNCDGPGEFCVSGECLVKACGDGQVVPGEECDDGNDLMCDGCEECQQRRVGYFDGSEGAYAEITDASGSVLGLSSMPYTVEAWMRVEGPLETVRVSRRASNVGWLFRVSPTMVGVCLCGTTDWIVNTSAFADGQWHHVAWTNDLSTSRFWVDGKLLGSKSVGNYIKPTNGQKMVIGAYMSPSGQVTDSEVGKIDELRMSNIVRYTETFAPPRRHSSDSHTLGLWHFDEGSGAAVVDEGPYNHQGLANNMQWLDDNCYGSSPEAAICGDGGLAAWEECDDGNEIEGDGCGTDCLLETCGGIIMDGQNDRMNCGTDGSLMIAGDVSIEYVWKSASVGGHQDLIRWGATGETSATNVLYRLGILPDGALSLYHENGSGADNYSSTPAGTVVPGQWLPLTAVRDTAAKTWTVYKGGQYSQTLSYANNPAGGSGGAFWIGAEPWGNGLYFVNGTIAHIRVWSRALDPVEVSDRSWKTIDPQAQSGLVGYWEFDEGSGSMAYDMSGHGNHCTLSGSPLWSESQSVCGP